MISKTSNAWGRAPAANEKTPDPTPTRGLTPDDDLVGHSEPIKITNPFGKRQHYDKPTSDLVGSTLPREVVEGIGFRTRKGNIRYDLCHLARAYHLYTRYKDVTEPLTYRQGVVVEQHELEFIASIQSFAEAAYRRFFKCVLFPDNTIVGHPTFEQFLQSTYKDFDRRVTASSYLYDLGHAASDEVVMGKGRDLFGKRWSMAGCPIDEASERLKEDPPRPMVLCAPPPDEKALEADSIAVMSYCEGLVAHEYQLHRAFTHSKTWYGEGSPWRTAAWLPWQQQGLRKRETRKRKERHVSIGAFREQEARTADPVVKQQRACIMPYLVAEIDAPDAQASMNYADLLIQRLKRLGADLSQVVVSFSGNRSFHVRIPMGMVGNPIFSSATEATRITREFFLLITEGLTGAHGTLISVLDSSVFSPNHMIRAVGSIHPKTGRFCVGYSGEDYLKLMLWEIEAHSEFSATRSRAERVPEWARRKYEMDQPPKLARLRLHDPSEATVVPELLFALMLAADAVSSSPEGPVFKGVIQVIKNGVGRGEEYYEGRVGRNRAALDMSLYCLAWSSSEHEAWERVTEWNRLNTPPLGEHPEDEKGELAYVFERARRYLRRIDHAPGPRMSNNSYQ